MRGIGKKTLCILIASIFLSSTIMAEPTLNEVQQQEKALKANIENRKKKVNENKEMESSVFSEIQKIDENISTIEEKIEDLNQKITTKQSEIENKEQELIKAQENESNQYDTFKKRIQFMYENGKTGYLQVLLRSNNFMDFLNRMDYVKQIMAFDQSILSKMKETKQEIVEMKKNLENERSQLSALKSETVVQKNAMEEAREKKGATLQTIRLDTQKQLQAIEEYEKEVKEVTALIKKLKTSMKYTGGKLGWPVPGHYYISSPYGYRTHPITGRKMDFHTAIDIPAPTGTKVLAAADGEVIRASYSRSYGNCVIINHGNENGKNISTLYAHNSKLLVKVGDYVKRGQAISLAGSTGDSTGPHVHFEVRIDGQHTDPMKYVTKQ